MSYVKLVGRRSLPFDYRVWRLRHQAAVPVFRDGYRRQRSRYDSHSIAVSMRTPWTAFSRHEAAKLQAEPRALKQERPCQKNMTMRQIQVYNMWLGTLRSTNHATKKKSRFFAMSLSLTRVFENLCRENVIS